MSDETIDDGWQWAIVEIFGHRKHAGRIREVEQYGTKMMRIDVPFYAGKQEGEKWPYKIVDMHLDRWETYYYGGASIFSLTPTDEATVTKIAESDTKIARPATYRLPAPDEARHADPNEPADDRETTPWDYGETK